MSQQFDGRNTNVINNLGLIPMVVEQTARGERLTGRQRAATHGRPSA